MNRHLIRLQRHSLPAIAMLFIVALIIPTGAVAAPPSCEDKPKRCEGGGGGGGGDKSSDLYTVEVFFREALSEDSFEPVGGASGVEGSGNKKRQSIGDVDPMNLDLKQMIAAMDGECAAIFDDEKLEPFSVGEFTIGTARLDSKSDDITYVTAAFWNFTVDESNYFLVFGPDGDGWIGDIHDEDPEEDPEDNWPPANSGESNFLSGYWLELQVTSGPAKTTSCHRLRITLDWKIFVTKE